MNASPFIHHRRLSVGPHIVMRPYRDQYAVWSPTLHRDVVMGAAEVAFLLKFTGGQEMDDIWREWLKMRGEEGSMAGAPPLELHTYLMIERYLAQGLLVEEGELKHDELGQLYFSGHEHISQEFFEAHSGLYYTMCLQALPHVGFLQASVPELSSDHLLCQLQDCLIRYRNPDLSHQEVIDERRLQLEIFLRLYDTYRQAENPQVKMWQQPFQVCQRPDGAWVLLGQVERACIALVLGLDIRVQRLQPADFLGKLVENPHAFFGTMRGNIPYQSIFDQGEELIRGRRPDVQERIQKIDAADLQGKTVLDLGCNIGMNCFLAVEHGARQATGIDLPELVGTASSLNSYFGMPCRFLARDLNYPVRDLGNYDTVFCFALLGHLASSQGLRQTIQSVKAKTVYVETHRDRQTQGDVDGLLSSSLFKKVDFLSYSLDNVACEQKTRRFYRCEVAS